MTANTVSLLDIINEENFLTKQESDELYHYLLKTCNFQQKNVVNEGKITTVPRLIKWFGIYDYFYSGINHEAQDLPETLQNLASKITGFLKNHNVEAHFNCVLINYYRDGKDKIGMHGDDETQLGSFPVIASLSLGDSRVFKMRHNVTREKVNFLLSHGQLFVMKGNTQNEWQHGIDSEANKSIRINLTFRYLKYPPVKKP